MTWLCKRIGHAKAPRNSTPALQPAQQRWKDTAHTHAIQSL